MKELDVTAMEEHYKGHIILVTTEHLDSKYRWKPTCKIKFTDGSRELIEDLQWDLSYNTPEEAERVGLLVSKKWIDAGKPNSRAAG
jgi:hypothetical protein